MAKQKTRIGMEYSKSVKRRNTKRTSIGCSTNTKPTNKHKKRSFKKYRGQGK